MENKCKITTIKLAEETKNRLDKLRAYPKESYDLILKKTLNILNICRTSPERARSRLGSINRQNRMNKKIEREMRE